MDPATTVAERQELMPMLKWLNGQFPDKFAARLEDKVQNLEGSRKLAAFRIGTHNASILGNTGKFRNFP